jgi:hypothetical protein
MITNAGAGAWCLWAHVERRVRSRYLWWAVIVAQSTVFIEAFLGVAVQKVDDVKPPDLHVLYAASAIVAVAILYGYRSTSPWVKEREFLVYSLGSFFIMGLGIRELFLV